MDKSIGLEFNNDNVRQLELLANGLEGVLLKKDTIETNFSLIMLNIESFIPNSNIFEYIFKTDISKRDKIKILIGRGKQYEKIKITDNKIEQLVNEIEEKTLLIRNEENELNDEYTIINKMNSKLSNMDNQINESEWRVYQGSGERALFDFLKNKLIVEKKLIK